MEECKEMVDKEWDLINQEEIDRLILSMPTHIAGCIIAEDGHTKY